MEPTWAPTNPLLEGHLRVYSPLMGNMTPTLES